MAPSQTFSDRQSINNAIVQRRFR